MINKIQKKFQGLKYAIDILEYEEDILTIKGWIFSVKYPVNGLEILIISQNRQYAIKPISGIRRNDVYRTFLNNNAVKSGFFGKILVEGLSSFEIHLMYRIGEKQYRIKIDRLKARKVIESTAIQRVERVNTQDSGVDLASLIKQRKEKKCFFSEEYYKQSIDIIIPIYNGYQYLERLLTTVPLTKMNYRLILIDDKSSDDRVYPFLENYAKNKPEVFLMRNEKNLGFVKSVNRGLELSSNHVALVNSDVELPEQWLERLMAPILSNQRVATSTPYSNCGVITSFPNLGENNELFENLSLKEIDREFQRVTPRYMELPTGVGFCMGMSRQVIQKIGLLDAKNFGMGYGEENDWCQRALQAGYKNVQVENLFVYHKHGGSFQSEEKKRLIENNSKILSKKHPTYEKQVSKFFTIDPNKDIREFIIWNLVREMKKPNTILAFDHSLGGGARSYLVGKRKEQLKAGQAFCIVSFRPDFNFYEFNYYYAKYRIKGFVKTRKQLFEILEGIEFDKIWVNELVTYPHIYDMLKSIRKFAKGKNIGIRMLIHDFFAVCPSVNLMKKGEFYCGVLQSEECKECFKGINEEKDLIEYGTIEKWREEWGEFLFECEEIIVFSNDSKKIMEKAFGCLQNIKTIPHRISYIPELKKKYKTTDTLNIGLLGVLTKHKGLEIIKELIKEIEKRKLNIRLVLIGSSSERINSVVFKETGRYTRGSIPNLVLQNDIDVFLISSICPETFSYTTDEIIHMGMPVMCFNIGAPAERVSAYKNGIVLSDMSVQTILGTVQNHPVIQNAISKDNRGKRLLFVVEQVTFSSRYRINHLREQLFIQGIASDCIMIEDFSKIDLKFYDNVIIYRSSLYKETESIVKKAHKLGKIVFYDTDDYIFDFNAIRHLEFLKGEDYKNFEEYSAAIYKSMEMCDEYIVSTENLKQAVEEKFAGKKVWVNRNVASLEMLTISKGVENIQKSDKVVLGYFSGSKTHDADFNKIKNVILNLMEENEKIHLLIGGQIELSSEFSKVYERIERFDFVDWRKLPSLIAKVDINLMPLESTFFHACKSENKWLEAALVHVPTIASWNNELELAIEDGVNGYLCKNEDEWSEKLQNLLNDSVLRKSIADKAHERVLQRYTTFYVESDLVKAIVK